MRTPRTNKSEQASSCKDPCSHPRRARGVEHVPRLPTSALKRRPRTSTGSGANSSLRLYFLQQQAERLRKEGAQLQGRIAVNTENLSAVAREIDVVRASNAVFCGSFQGKDGLEEEQGQGKRQRAGKKKWNTMVLGY